MSTITEQKTIESDSKQQLHSKPGSLSEKLAVLGTATEQAIQPTAVWLQEKANKILPESMTHAQEHAHRLEAAKAQTVEGTVHNEADHPTAAVPLKGAIVDVGTHIAESLTNSLKPVQAAMAPIVAKTMATVEPIVAPIEAKVIAKYHEMTGTAPAAAAVPADATCHSALPDPLMQEAAAEGAHGHPHLHHVQAPKEELSQDIKEAFIADHKK